MMQDRSGNYYRTAETYNKQGQHAIKPLSAEGLNLSVINHWTDPPWSSVCKNVDIRNTVQNFRKVENCTVIEGYLQILLIDNGQTRDYEGLSFPKLVEITGYLLLYRAFGLNSVGRIFPNLAVIRGNVLFHNYAVVIFEMYHLQEIGLHHLTDILGGSVRIEKNPGLCYVDTVDWDLIAKEGKGGHFFKHNKKKDECPNVCPSYCPNITRDGKSVPLCWNSQHCQKVCPITCEKNATCSTDINGNVYCCQQECLGGCYGTTAYDCVACKHVLFESKCLKKCPPGTFELLGRRCVQELECRTFQEKDSNNNKIYWKPFKGQCIAECPPGYIEAENDKHACKQCIGKCPKICKGMVVDHMSAAKKFHGCTIINGSLEIHIRGGSNVIRKLEESMSLIQEIHGYLKIARSFPLISLNFLKSLRIIYGDQLDKKNYAFLVLDNQNLQELWDWKSRKERLEIRKGKIFFHFNSKLCISKIEELKKYADVLEWDDRDVSPSSNGDRVACDVTNMNVSVVSLGSRSVRVQFDSFKKYLHDERSLLGYVIYYREAPYQNITMFEGRDACGSDVWTVRDVEISDLTDSHIKHTITDLKPFTQYALYIRTYTTASGRQGAQSSIVYFQTKSDIPSPPVNIKAHSTLHGEIVISWDPPKRPNGNVTHYIVEGSNDEDLSGLINQRNYCSEPIAYPDYTRIYDDTYDDNFAYKHISLIDYLNTTTPNSVDDDDDLKCCSCSKDSHSVNYDDDEAEFQIHFEDFLQNTVYIKNPNIHRNRRHINSLPGEERSLFTDQNIEDLNVLPVSHSVEGDKYVDSYLYEFKRYVYHRPFLVVSNLKHFTEYTIEIRACQDYQSSFNTEFCSLKAITTVRTLPLEGADDIRSSSLHVQTENVTAAYSAFAKWEEPKDPNGVIVAYVLEYHRLDADHFKPNRICVTRSNYLQHNGFYLSDLLPGNYSLRVKANSLAKYGNWTAHIYFEIVAKSEYTTWLWPVLSIFVIISIAIILFAIYHLKFKQRIPDYVDYASVNPEYISSHLVYEPDEWEIPREKIKLLEELGQGSFGMVYKGEIHDLNGKPFVPCAAKTVNESATLRERIEFLQEASVMKIFVDCNHVVKLLGVVSKGQPTLVIMELMPNGDLKSYLRSHRPDSEDYPDAQPPSFKQILQMAAEIADGMAYLAAKKFVHRDLAARNCMVAEDLTVKIGDFGMTRDIYETDYYRKGGKGLLPVRWMSPESLQDGIFDCQSDVWSYGVVLWEMATLASQPYQGLSNEEVLKFVISGNTMTRPEDCPESLYDIMVMCWHKNPKARPTFIEIIEILLPKLNQKFHQISFYHTQHLPNSTDHEEADAPTSPLRSPVHAEDNDQSVYRYFPSATQIPEDNPNFIFDNGGDAIASCSNYGAEASNCNDGSKGVSINYSDGSKGSKISNISNGSIPNGHVHLTLG